MLQCMVELFMKQRKVMSNMLLHIEPKRVPIVVANITY